MEAEWGTRQRRSRRVGVSRRRVQLRREDAGPREAGASERNREIIVGRWEFHRVEHCEPCKEMERGRRGGRALCGEEGGRRKGHRHNTNIKLAEKSGAT